MEHYTYISIGDDYRVYIGVRTSKGKAEDDVKYLGSPKSEPKWVKEHNPVKRILAKYNTREQAEQAERWLQAKFDAPPRIST